MTERGRYREREREREGERGRERQTHRETESERECERMWGIGRESEMMRRSHNVDEVERKKDESYI